MNTTDVLKLAADLIRIKSLSGKEQEIVNYLDALFKNWGWKPELLEVEPNRCNILVSFGRPEILFTTHVDIVPGADFLFEPKQIGDRLCGRGACDTKGIIATMIASIKDLLAKGGDNFGLLLVVGEELDGSGAKAAARQLQGRGIRFIINGEPTEGLVMKAHKGVLGLAISCDGRACHSGYPELGVDANKKLIKVLTRLIEADWPKDSILGETTLNVGQIKGGAAGNIISSRAEANLLFRSVCDNEILLATVKGIVGSEASLKVNYAAPPVFLKDIPELKSGIASYCTDIPNFAPLNAEAVLYGPGTIHLAHTDEESIGVSDIEDARRGYDLIFHRLKSEIA
jgi:acetylornithine deacetylase